MVHLGPEPFFLEVKKIVATKNYRYTHKMDYILFANVTNVILHKIAVWIHKSNIDTYHPYSIIPIKYIGSIYNAK